jgi:two-component system, sensor histidine kinase and response regulator
MDMQMPDLDGLAATRMLRADSQFEQLPIIAMTANTMKADLDACLAAGMNDYVIKPIDRQALLQTLRRWLPGRTDVEVSASASAPAPEPPPPLSTPTSTPLLDGLDITGTLQRLGLDFDTLRRMLVRFADGQAPTLDALRAGVAFADLTALGVPVGAEADLAQLRDRVYRYEYDEAQTILARIVAQFERTSVS